MFYKKHIFYNNKRLINLEEGFKGNLGSLYNERVQHHSDGRQLYHCRGFKRFRDP